MKKLIVIALTACTLFGSTISASASVFNGSQPTKINGTDLSNLFGGKEPTKINGTDLSNLFGGSQQTNAITNYSKLGVGHWTSLTGDSIKVVSGSQYVTIQGMIVIGKAPGTAVIDAYKNGVLYSRQYLTIVRY